ncbi:MAG: transposase family protein [Bacteroides stercoris]
MTVFLHTAGKGASCPYCGHFSHRLHSYYSRHIEDLEVYGHTLELVIKVGKYYCDNVSCPQKYSANRCLFWLVGMVDGAILLRNASDR